MILGQTDFSVKDFQDWSTALKKKHHRIKQQVTKKTLRGAHLAQAT